MFLRRARFLSYVLLTFLFIYSRLGSAAERIISLAPNLTETLFALGVGPEIVGVTTYCQYPREAEKIQKIGNFLSPNFEMILALKPTVIFMERWPSSKTAERLKQLGLRYVETPSPRSFPEIYQLIDILGRETHQEKKAAEMVKRMRQRIAEIDKRGKALRWHPKVYIEIDPPTWTVGKQSFISEAIRLAGGQNIFADVNERALQASKEAIVERDPDLVLSFHFSAAEIKNRPGWNKMSAVRENHIIDNFNQELLTHGNYRVVDGMERLQNILGGIVSSREAKK